MKSILVHAAAYIAAIILLQTLYFKFTAQPESVYIFSQLGLEPVGRIGSGIAELIAGILLLVPKTRIWGSFLGLASFRERFFRTFLCSALRFKMMVERFFDWRWPFLRLAFLC